MVSNGVLLINKELENDFDAAVACYAVPTRNLSRGRQQYIEKRNLG
jgi:hypothetical protein